MKPYCQTCCQLCKTIGKPLVIILTVLWLFSYGIAPALGNSERQKEGLLILRVRHQLGFWGTKIRLIVKGFSTTDFSVNAVTGINRTLVCFQLGILLFANLFQFSRIFRIKLNLIVGSCLQEDTTPHSFNSVTSSPFYSSPMIDFLTHFPKYSV